MYLEALIAAGEERGDVVLLSFCYLRYIQTLLCCCVLTDLTCVAALHYTLLHYIEAVLYYAVCRCCSLLLYIEALVV
jgi:hypothetical protein